MADGFWEGFFKEVKICYKEGEIYGSRVLGGIW
jgi:hypothetical protein